MTAVTWLLEELKKVHHPTEAMIMYAKKLEKQQIIDAAADHCYPTCELATVDAEKYYNETYGSKGSDDHIVDTNEMVSSQTEISDEEIHKDIFNQAILAMEELYGSGCDAEIDAYFRGAVWYREQLKQKQ